MTDGPVVLFINADDCILLIKSLMKLLHNSRNRGSGLSISSSCKKPLGKEQPAEKVLEVEIERFVQAAHFKHITGMFYCLTSLLNRMYRCFE